MICKFNNLKCEFINGGIKNIKRTNIAYEMFLCEKYQKKCNYSIEVMWNTCLSPWVIKGNEKDVIFENAKTIFNGKYGKNID